MKLLDARVKWNVGWVNNPDLYILVNKMVNNDVFRFEERDGLYYAEKDGQVRFYAYDRPGDGFGGDTFNIRMKNGQTKDLVGPWSSRAGVMNKYGFGPCCDAIITDEKDVWKRGYTFWGSAITTELFEQAISLINDKLDSPIYIVREVRQTFDKDCDADQGRFIGEKSRYLAYDQDFERNSEWILLPSLSANDLVKPEKPQNFNVLRDYPPKTEWTPRWDTSKN